MAVLTREGRTGGTLRGFRVVRLYWGRSILSPELERLKFPPNFKTDDFVIRDNGEVVWYVF